MNGSAQERLTLMQLLPHAKQWDGEFTETESVWLDGIQVSDDALVLAGNSLRMDQDTRNRLFAKAARLCPI